MSYFIATRLNCSPEAAEDRATSALEDEGFGVLTRIDLQTKLEEKQDTDVGPYVILGACHPPSALEAVRAESRVGLMLPCNVIVRAHPEGGSEVAAIDPAAMMEPIGNNDLREVAYRVRDSLRRTIDQVAKGPAAATGS